MSTWENIRTVLESGYKLHKSGDGYRCVSPLRPDAENSNNFVITVKPDGEHGAYHDKVSDEGGSLYQLANLLGVEIERTDKYQVEDTKRGYDSLDDYATAHGLTGVYLRDMGFTETTIYNRPAFTYPTASGDRIRFLDGNEPRYMPVNKGYKACWYGLHRAIEMSQKMNVNYIVLCNGEISTIAAQLHGIPACCITSGERKNGLPQNLLEELNNVWDKELIIALDADETGRAMAKSVKSQVHHSIIVQLPLSEHGDLADWCMLHGKDALISLLKLVDAQNPKVSPNPHETETQSDKTAFRELGEMIRGERDIKIKAFLNPFKSIHKLGGLAKVCVSGKVTLIIGGTGTGKTQLLESWVDNLTLNGYNGGWHGEEWDKYEMQARRVQRWSKVPLDYIDIILHQLWVSEHKDGIADEFKHGVRLTDEQYYQYNYVEEMFTSYPGHVEYAERFNSINDVFDDMETYIDRMRIQRKQVHYMVFDYVQLLKANSPDKSVNRFEYAFELCKKFAETHNVHVFMTSQANKLSQSELEAGKTLGLQDAHFVRADKANTVYSLNRVWLSGDDKPIETPCFWLTPLKSSIRKKRVDNPKGVPILMNGSKLHFMDYYMRGGQWVDWTRDKNYSHIPDNIHYGA